ncbi:MULTISPECIES: XRE family transcriptional regulator [unclassified Dietzia]|uniref:XRE family transcriptional regulator n=1 Tax=unclassified Dietzia TaxID=2617939 RepID=UPI0015FDC31B|nr:MULTISPECIES: XRE family transcriptional regulator [unclassified Dietzia]MBB1023341.1 ImmA/IrrE family metallo-endopeptidase [Dietzia sp. DQ12-76]MBB1027528.1 ImmA/IrrE family metallo-endopeptidase [Dietzia sp. DQ11-38-2]
MDLLSDQVQGHRIVTLRELEGLTQVELAQMLGVSQGFVSQFEKGVRPVPNEVAERAAEVFELPIEFFHVPTIPAAVGVATFRKNSAATVRDEKRILALHGEASRLFAVASEQSGYHTADLDDAIVDDVEETAGNLRSILGLGADAPILNVTRALERLGVGVVASLDPGGVSSDHSGVSRPSRSANRPLVAVAADQPGDRFRFTLAHELAHLLYDRDRTAPVGGVRSPVEKRAHGFAGALMLPASAMKDRVGESLTLHGYLRVKAEFGASVGAITYRARSLRLISEQRYRSLQIQLSSQGWRKNEPVEVAAEEPILLAQAVEHGISPDPAVVSSSVGLSRTLVERWTGLKSVNMETLGDVIPLRRQK